MALISHHGEPHDPAAAAMCQTVEKRHTAVDRNPSSLHSAQRNVGTGRLRQRRSCTKAEGIPAPYSMSPRLAGTDLVVLVDIDALVRFPALCSDLDQWVHRPIIVRLGSQAARQRQHEDVSRKHALPRKQERCDGGWR